MNKESRVKVLVVEDSQLIRECLVTLFSDIEGVEIVGQSETAVGAIDAIRDLRPNVVVLDLKLRHGNGTDVLQFIKKEKIASTVVVLTNYVYPFMREKCAELGADFFFDKATEFQKVVEVLAQHIE